MADRTPSDAGTPLARLNQHIHDAARAQAAAQGLDTGLETAGTDSAPGLRSAVRFHAMWARLDAEDAVTQAAEQAPSNAGPLNSHMLALRTLETLRSLSPGYLYRFLAYLDTLARLENVRRPGAQRAKEPPPAAATRKAGASRTRRTRG